MYLASLEPCHGPFLKSAFTNLGDMAAIHFPLAGAGHNDTYLRGGRDYFETWRAFLAGLPPSPSPRPRPNGPAGLRPADLGFIFMPVPAQPPAGRTNKWIAPPSQRASTT